MFLMDYISAMRKALELKFWILDQFDLLFLMNIFLSDFMDFLFLRQATLRAFEARTSHN